MGGPNEPVLAIFLIFAARVPWYPHCGLQSQPFARSGALNFFSSNDYVPHNKQNHKRVNEHIHFVKQGLIDGLEVVPWCK
jgi:hypothetical protein